MARTAAGPRWERCGGSLGDCRDPTWRRTGLRRRLERATSLTGRWTVSPSPWRKRLRKLRRTSLLSSWQLCVGLFDHDSSGEQRCTRRAGRTASSRLRQPGAYSCDIGQSRWRALASGGLRLCPNAAVRLRLTAPAERRSHSWRAIVPTCPEQPRPAVNDPPRRDRAVRRAVGTGGDARWVVPDRPNRQRRAARQA